MTREYINQHGSAFFFLSMVLLSIAFMFIGISIYNFDSVGMKAVSIILLQLSGSLIAVSFTALFLSLPDMRQYLSSTVVSLISSGDAVSLLSNDIKATMKKKLILDKLQDEASGVDPSLYKSIERLTDRVLSSPYATNTHYSISLTDHDRYPDIVRYHLSISYRLNAQNQSINKIPFFHYFAANFQINDRNIVEENWLETFTMKIGDKEYGKSHVDIVVEPAGTTNLFSCKFSKEIDVNGDVDVSIQATYLCPKGDPVYVCYVRFPSQGYHATLTYKNDLEYDCAWFLSCRIEEDIPLKGSIEKLPNGISATTNDWILPGEGVALYHYKTDC